MESLTEPKKKLLIATTHLFFHPRANNIRLLQTLACVQHLSSLLESRPDEVSYLRHHCTYSVYQFDYFQAVPVAIQTWIFYNGVTCVASDLFSRPQDIGVVLCGDLNSHPINAVHELLTTGSVCGTHADWYSGTFRSKKHFNVPTCKNAMNLSMLLSL